MDLESKVQAFAEEARRILLQRALEQKTQKGEKAFWQGYTTNGNGIVKKDGIYIVVKVIGNVAISKNAVVYVDEQNTIEIGFKKSLPVARGQKKEQLRPTIADKVKRPLLLIIEDVAPLNLGDFLLSYGYAIAGYTLRSTTRNQKTSQMNLSQPGTGTNIVSGNNQSDTYSNKSSYYFAATNMHVGALAAFGQGSYTSEISLSGTPWDVTVSATTSGFGWSYDDVAQTNFGTTSSSSITSTIEWSLESDLTGSGVVGDFSTEWQYFTPPETKYYIQGGDIGDDPTASENIEIELQSYFSDTIVDYELLHNYTKKEQTGPNSNSKQTFLIFYVETVDFSYSEVYTTSATSYYQYYPWETQYRGRLKRWYLHIKINHSDGSIDYKTTLQQYNTRGQDYNSQQDGREWFDAREGWDVFAGLFSFHSSLAGGWCTGRVVSHDDSGWYHFMRPNFEDILSQTYEGDWLYEWRNVQIPYNTTANPWPSNFVTDFILFLRLNFYEGIWYSNLNSDKLDSSDTVYSWEPSVVYANSYGIGIPPNTTISSISNLISLFNSNYNNEGDYPDYFDGSVSGVPNVYGSWVTNIWGVASPPFAPLIQSGYRGTPWFTYTQTIPLPP